MLMLRTRRASPTGSNFWQFNYIVILHSKLSSELTFKNAGVRRWCSCFACAAPHPLVVVSHNSDIDLFYTVHCVAIWLLKWCVLVWILMLCTCRTLSCGSNFSQFRYRVILHSTSSSELTFQNVGARRGCSCFARAVPHFLAEIIYKSLSIE